MIEARQVSRRDRLFAQNDRGLTATHDPRFKLVAAPGGGRSGFALYDRLSDPGETSDVSARRPDALRGGGRDLELFLEAADRESAATRRLLAGAPTGEAPMSREACEKLKALGYVAGALDCGS